MLLPKFSRFRPIFLPWNIRISKNLDSRIIIPFLNLDGSRYFKNTEGKDNSKGRFYSSAFEGAKQHVGGIPFWKIPQISQTYIMWLPG
jgi:hypothetical protein